MFNPIYRLMGYSSTASTASTTSTTTPATSGAVPQPPVVAPVTPATIPATPAVQSNQDSEPLKALSRIEAELKSLQDMLSTQRLSNQAQEDIFKRIAELTKEEKLAKLQHQLDTTNLSPDEYTKLFDRIKELTQEEGAKLEKVSATVNHQAPDLLTTLGQRTAEKQKDQPKIGNVFVVPVNSQAPDLTATLVQRKKDQQSQAQDELAKLQQTLNTTHLSADAYQQVFNRITTLTAQSDVNTKDKYHAFLRTEIEKAVDYELDLRALSPQGMTLSAYTHYMQWVAHKESLELTLQQETAGSANPYTPKKSIFKPTVINPIATRVLAPSITTPSAPPLDNSESSEESSDESSDDDQVSGVSQPVVSSMNSSSSQQTSITQSIASPVPPASFTPLPLLQHSVPYVQPVPQFGHPYHYGNQQPHQQ